MNPSGAAQARFDRRRRPSVPRPPRRRFSRCPLPLRTDGRWRPGSPPCDAGRLAGQRVQCSPALPLESNVGGKTGEVGNRSYSLQARAQASGQSGRGQLPRRFGAGLRRSCRGRRPDGTTACLTGARGREHRPVGPEPPGQVWRPSAGASPAASRPGGTQLARFAAGRWPRKAAAMASPTPAGTWRLLPAASG